MAFGTPASRGTRRAAARRRTALALAAAIAAGIGAPASLVGASAQDAGTPTEDGTDAATALSVIADAAERALARNRPQDAAPLYQDLCAKDPQNLEYKAKWAFCLYEIGKLEEAQTTYEQVLRADPNNVVALIQMARIKARLHSGRTNKEEQERLRGEAKAELITAARFGANCLRAIAAYPELSKLFIADIDLKLELVSAPQRERSVQQRRDPFRDPRPRRTDEGITVRPPVTPGKTRLSDAEQRERVAQLRALLPVLKKHIDANNYEEVTKVWSKIDAILAESDLITEPAVLQDLKDLEAQLQRDKFIVKRLILTSFFSRGQRIVNDMEIALGESDYHRVFEEWQVLGAHVKQMEATDPGFKSSGQKLLGDGKVFYDRAKVLEEIDRFSFSISGIVVGGGVAAAIINGRVIGENERVFGQDNLPIEGLRVVKIKRQRVRFRYKDTDFERLLETSATTARGPGRPGPAQ